MSDHLPECPCNNADERGCFLISAETGKCVSCTCDMTANADIANGVSESRQRNDIRNDSHLPECECYGRNHGECALCICDRLRACEQRVREEWYEVQSETWEQGYWHGLDKAREAVAKIPKEDGGYCHVLHACDVEDAIDDLRKEQK